MPLLTNKYQPYFPDPDNPAPMDCGSDEYCHPLSDGDKIYTQFYQTPCESDLACDGVFEDSTVGAELVTNGSFTGSSAGWSFPGSTWAYGSNNMINTGGSDLPLFQTIAAIVLGEVYEVSITISNYTTGQVRLGFGDGSGQFSTAWYAANGVYTTSLKFIDSGDVGLLKVDCSADFIGTVDDVSVKLVDFPCWDIGDDWLIDSSGASKVGPGTDPLINDTTDYALMGGYYYVKGLITNYVSGTLVPSLGGTNGTPITSGGIFESWITPGADGTIVFTPTPDFFGTIEYVEVFKLRNDYLFSLIGDDTYDISSSVSYYQDKVTLIYDPEGDDLPYGCYYIEVRDECDIQYEEIVVDGGFSEGFTHWNGAGALAQFDLSAGNAEFIYPIPVGFLQILAPLVISKVPDPLRILKGANYRMSFEIISNSDPVNTGFRMGLGGEGVTPPWETAVGVHTFDTFIAADIPDSQINYKVGGLANFNLAGAGVPGSTQNIVVDNLSLRRIEPFDATYTSECIKFAASHAKTRLMQAYCEHDAYGFDFVNTGFVFSQRMVMRSHAPMHEKSKQIYQFNSGNAMVGYAEDEKWTELYFGLASETAHDTVAAMIDFDHFTIGTIEADQTEYLVKPEDYIPEWPRDGSYNLAPSRINIRIKEGGQKYNRKC